MGSRNRMSVARPCCGTCNYQASDGNAWSDTFDTLDPSWITLYPAYDTFIASGRLTCLTEGTPPGTSSDLYRDVTITPAGLKVIVESNVYRQTSSATTGVFFSPNRGFSIFARWNFGNVGLYAFGIFTITGSSVQSGDKLSLRIEHISGYQYRACYHKNGTKIHEATGTWTFGTDERHGVSCTPGGGTVPTTIGEWDNYSCHIGNP